MAVHVSIPPSLTTFTGSSHEDVSDFLEQLKRLINAEQNVTGAQKLFLLELHTAGAAQRLVTRELDWLRDNDTDPPRTADAKFTYVADALRDAFQVETDAGHFRTLLQSRVKLPSESYQVYIQDILELCRKAGITSVADQIRECHKGCDPEIAFALLPTGYASVTDFTAAVTALQACHQAVRRAHAASALESGSVPSMVPSMVPPAACAWAPWTWASPSPPPPSAAAPYPTASVARDNTGDAAAAAAAPDPDHFSWTRNEVRSLLSRIARLIINADEYGDPSAERPGPSPSPTQCSCPHDPECPLFEASDDEPEDDGQLLDERDYDPEYDDQPPGEREYDPDYDRRPPEERDRESEYDDPPPNGGSPASFNY